MGQGRAGCQGGREEGSESPGAAHTLVPRQGSQHTFAAECAKVTVEEQARKGGQGWARVRCQDMRG